MDLASPSDLHDAPEQKRRKLLKERIDQVHYTLFIFSTVHGVCMYVCTVHIYMYVCSILPTLHML